MRTSSTWVCNALIYMFLTKLTESDTVVSCLSQCPIGSTCKTSTNGRYNLVIGTGPFHGSVAETVCQSCFKTHAASYTATQKDLNGWKSFNQNQAWVGLYTTVSGGTTNPNQFRFYDCVNKDLANWDTGQPNNDPSPQLCAKVFRTTPSSTHKIQDIKCGDRTSVVLCNAPNWELINCGTPSSPPTTSRPTSHPSTSQPSTSQPSTSSPSISPSTTQSPSATPSATPSSNPTTNPTKNPSMNPTSSPSKNPTAFPVTSQPTDNPVSSTTNSTTTTTRTTKLATTSTATTTGPTSQAPLSNEISAGSDDMVLFIGGMVGLCMGVLCCGAFCALFVRRRNRDSIHRNVSNLSQGHKNSQSQKARRLTSRSDEQENIQLERPASDFESGLADHAAIDDAVIDVIVEDMVEGGREEAVDIERSPVETEGGEPGIVNNMIVENENEFGEAPMDMWTSRDVVSFVSRVGPGSVWAEIGQKFRANRIDGRTLRHMTEEDLKEIGVAPYHVKPLHLAIEEKKFTNEGGL